MLNRAPLFLALRYLRPRRSFVSVITIISVLGVMVGVLMMIVVRAVMSGFEVEFREALIGSEPHAHIARPTQARDARPWREVLAAVQAQPLTASAAPLASGGLYVERGELQTGLQVMGLPPEHAGLYLQKLRKHLLMGTLDLADGTLVLPDYWAQDLGVGIGDEVSVYPAPEVNQMVRKFRAANEIEDKDKKKEIYQQIKLPARKLIVTGILRTETAGPIGYLSLATGQELYALRDGVTGLAVELKDPNRADEFASLIRPAATGWDIHLWTDANKARLAAMSNEQFVMAIVLWIIALVAAFSVMNTTITVTTQKRREIGVITALGAGRRQVVNIFVYQALIVGIIGTALGLGGSLLILEYRNEIRAVVTGATGGQVHAVEGIFLSSIPAYIDPWHIVKTCAASISLCITAGLVPALFAASVDPAVALRD